MILITGGAFQGKCSYAKQEYGVAQQNIVDGEVSDKEVLFHAEVIDHFHLFIQKMIENQENTKLFLEELLVKNPEVIIITTELGCGIVPINAKDRAFREEMGRISVFLAKRAKRVIRMICGIGMEIKTEDEKDQTIYDKTFCNKG